MHALAVAIDTPEWVVAEMPPGYQTRIAEIQRLSEELQGMSRYAQLLWSIGEDLREPVRGAFATLKFEAALMEAPAESAVAVTLDGQRRLLLHVSSAEETLDRRSAEIEHAFHLLHQVAGERDRVVLVTNNDRMHPPGERQDAISPEALRLLERMGVNCVTGPTLFKIWILGNQSVERARRFVDLIHDQDGGTITFPA